MLKATCDRCDTESVVVASLYTVPEGWSDMTLTGQIKMAAGGINRQSVKRLLCAECTGKIFDVSADAPKTIREQFEDAAMDYFDELAIEAMERIAEDGP